MSTYLLSSSRSTQGFSPNKLESELWQVKALTTQRAKPSKPNQIPYRRTNKASKDVTQAQHHPRDQAWRPFAMHVLNPLIQEHARNHASNSNWSFHQNRMSMTLESTLQLHVRVMHVPATKTLSILISPFGHTHFDYACLNHEGLWYCIP